MRKLLAILLAVFVATVFVPQVTVAADKDDLTYEAYQDTVTLTTDGDTGEVDLLSDSDIVAREVFVRVRKDTTASSPECVHMSTGLDDPDDVASHDWPICDDDEYYYHQEGDINFLSFKLIDTDGDVHVHVRVLGEFSDAIR